MSTNGRSPAPKLSQPTAAPPLASGAISPAKGSFGRYLPPSPIPSPSTTPRNDKLLQTPASQSVRGLIEQFEVKTKHINNAVSPSSSPSRLRAVSRGSASASLASSSSSVSSMSATPKLDSSSSASPSVADTPTVAVLDSSDEPAVDSLSLDAGAPSSPVKSSVSGLLPLPPAITTTITTSAPTDATISVESPASKPAVPSPTSEIRKAAEAGIDLPSTDVVDVSSLAPADLLPPSSTVDDSLATIGESTPVSAAVSDAGVDEPVAAKEKAVEEEEAKAAPGPAPAKSAPVEEVAPTAAPAAAAPTSSPKPNPLEPSPVTVTASSKPSPKPAAAVPVSSAAAAAAAAGVSREPPPHLAPVASKPSPSLASLPPPPPHVNPPIPESGPHPLTHKHTLFFSDTSPTKGKKATSTSASAYSHGLEPLCTVATLEEFGGAWKALRSMLAGVNDGNVDDGLGGLKQDSNFQ